MWGLKYLLLCAWTAAAAWYPAKGEAIVDGRRPKRLYDEGDSMYIGGGTLRKRDSPGAVNAYCRYWGHSSALVGEKVYMTGGIATFKENFRNNWIYLYYAAIMADLSGGVQFPVDANNSIFAYIVMGDDGEGTQQGAFWWDGGNYIWKYGGWFANDKTWTDTPQARVRHSDMWRLDLSRSTWENKSIDPANIHRAWGGATASVPEKQLGYFLGGIVENRTDTAYADAPGYLVLKDSFLNYDSGTNVFANRTAPKLGHTALGNMVYISGMGQDGLLVYLGGAEGPSGWVPTGTTDGMKLRDLGTIWIYDIQTTRWYSQKTSGKTPPGRISACSVVIPSQDNSSWNIFMHGGGTLGETSGDVYGDTWVLSLPTFQWVQVDTKGDKKFEHTCHVVKGNRLLVIGGRDKQQEFSGDPANDYSVDASDWSCLKRGIFSSLNLNTFDWEDSLPIDDDTFEVNKLIVGKIGGK